MDNQTPQEIMAGKLLVGSFSHTTPAVQEMSDPIAETPMIVTLDELFPYELDPRLTRNPLYDQIKQSIRERGLDAPPPITRRPGAKHYIIRNGGNTRLSIMRELWSETKDEQFFRFLCMFKPWPKRGEIVALTGHLAENELHGGLTFIERALGIEKARELYALEIGKAVSQSELARRLAQDGYPVPQPHISRMQDAINYLLPAIPNLLYGGLGRPQVEKLTMLRKAGLLVWEERARGKNPPEDFPTLFHEVLSMFDSDPAAYSMQRFQDELVGQMAQYLEANYDTITLALDELVNRQRVLTSDRRDLGDVAPLPAPIVLDRPQAQDVPPLRNPDSGAESTLPETQRQPAPSLSPDAAKTKAQPQAGPPDGERENEARHLPESERLGDNIISPVATTERLQTIQQLVSEHAGEPAADFTNNMLHAIPIQVDGLYPITDLWTIQPNLDTPEALRIHIAQFAREIAKEVGVADSIEPRDTGLGFVCQSAATAPTMQLLSSLSSVSPGTGLSVTAPSVDFASVLQDSLLLPSEANARISDAGLVKLFRIIRLARRLLDMEATSSVL
ncbi:ParB family protein [Pseudomonas aeruginosa]|uniref:ParB family protein n=1 Tax=Pseudomonas aeruginosa TaxID=287 RepID=UPI000F7F13C2|nr:ParB family protein [Pseudomonas aeruginosa]RTB44083.1 hypothetical protein EJ655_08055 [Pseudomonas aeruginosa]